MLASLDSVRREGLLAFGPFRRVGRFTLILSSRTLLWFSILRRRDCTVSNSEVSTMYSHAPGESCRSPSI